MSASATLEFEKPIVELEHRIFELRNFSKGKHVDISAEIRGCEEKLEQLKKDIYGKLTPWQRVQIARHPKRPYTLDYVGLILTDFIELKGDRLFREDPAIVCGLAKLDGRKIMLIGHQKGRDTKENVFRSFGCPHPEGYRKALRMMRMAERFNLPVVCFIDTPGAYPGVGAEERGQAEAIAINLREMSQLETPVLVTVIGEGGSGGALGIGVGDHICMFENAYYSVISPEGCAAILWRSRLNAPQAAEALKITGEDLLKLKIIDEIIPEPLGGAHRDYPASAAALKASLKKNLAALCKVPREILVQKRYEKFRAMGAWEEVKG